MPSVSNFMRSIKMTEADQGFNAVFMMPDSGARGSKDQIKQLSGYLRGKRNVMQEVKLSVCFGNK